MKVTLSKREKLLFRMQIFTMILAIGMSLQFMVVQANGGKMPLLAESHLYTADDEHLIYVHPSEIKYHYLADITPVGFGYKASAGDFVMFIGLLGIVIYGFLFAREVMLSSQGIND